MIKTGHVLIFSIGMFMLGFLTRDIYITHSAKMQATYSIGTCLSNGLYYEKITGIRYSNVLSVASYELLPTIHGELRSPGTTEAWIVDKNYVVVADSNCL